MNLKTIYERGQAGLNMGLPTGIKALDIALRGIQRKTLIGVAAAPKVGKCLGVGTKVIMYDFSMKKVEDIIQGDLLLGLDGKPNRVLSTTTGTEMMYCIHQSKSMLYRVNESHILSLKRKDETVNNITITDYFNQTYKEKKYNSYGYKFSPVIDYKTVQLDPYYLGLWLGDGSSANDNITAVDPEILDWLKSFSLINKYEMKHRCNITYNFKSINNYTLLNDGVLIGVFNKISDITKITGIKSEYISRGLLSNEIYINKNYSVTKDVQKPLIQFLRELNVINNKHIPLLYINNSEEVRLNLLAGLIDSDGHLTHKRLSYEIVQKNKLLCEQIKLLADSLGFSTRLTEKIATMKKKDGSVYSCLVYRLGIKGDVSKIPVKVWRKKATPLTKSSHSKIKVTEDKIDTYYGFSLENEDKRFYLEDFTVTHNSTLTDFAFVISPYLLSPEGTEIDWIYFSFEEDRIKKEFKFAAYFFLYDYGVTSFRHSDGNTYNISVDYLMGLLQNETTKEQVKVSAEHEDMLKNIYISRIIPLFGRYDEEGRKLQKGKIDFIEEKSNPTGLRNYLLSYARENGEFIYEEFLVTNPDKTKEKRSRIVGYKANNPDKYTIIITDTLRKIPPERGFSKKETIDKYLEYQVEMRNWCKYSFIDIIHLNRNMADIERLKFMKDCIYPTGDDVKDTGNLSEECNALLTMFNANDDKYNLKSHFGMRLIDEDGMRLHPNYRSIHLVESRDGTQCPRHMQVNMHGANNNFTPLI